MNTDEHGSKRMRRGGLRALMAGASAVALAWTGCSLPEAQPDLTRFYVLTPSEAGVEQASAADAREVRVVLKSIEVPQFLRGNLMQVRLSANEVDFVDSERWAEPLEAGLGRVLQENLNGGETGVRVVSRRVDEHTLDVTVRLKHCEGVMPAGVARLGAKVEIHSAGIDARQLAEEDVLVEVPGWDGEDFTDLAAKLSEAAAKMSGRIAEMVRAASRAE